MAKHLDLLVCESTFDAIIVPAETIVVVCTMLELWAVIERLLRVHEERVGLSFIPKVRDLEREQIILTVKSVLTLYFVSEKSVTSVIIGIARGCD